MSTNVFLDQATMLKAFQQTVNLVNPKQASLYLKLILEEVGETLIASNPTHSTTIEHLTAALGNFALYNEDEANIVEVFDGIIDVLVVTINLGHSLNLPLQEGWDEVLRSNMAKVDPKTGQVVLREDGKVLKPAGWASPNLHKVWGENLNKKFPKEPENLPTADAHPAESLGEVVAGLSLSDRYLNLALMEIGSCLTLIGNLRQRRVEAGPEFTEAKLGLLRAIAALGGEKFVPPADKRETDELTKLKALVRELENLTEIEKDEMADANAGEYFCSGYNVAISKLREKLGAIHNKFGG